MQIALISLNKQLFSHKANLWAIHFNLCALILDNNKHILFLISFFALCCIIRYANKTGQGMAWWIDGRHGHTLQL